MDSYSYYANNTSLLQVIRDFSAGFGFSVHSSPKIHGVLSGRLVSANPTQFMNRLASMFGLHWFTNAGTLYVSLANEAISRSIRVPTATLGQIKQALIDLGTLDPRFGWGALTTDNIVMVSGPPEYVQLVISTIKQLPIVAGGMQVAVFRIHHASVQDRTITFRNHEIVTPGLANILRALLTGQNIPNLSVAENQHLQKVAAPLHNDRSAVQNLGTTIPSHVDSSHLQSIPHKGAYQGSTIEADPRLNALIIRDIPERLVIYGRLIKELDVATALVEIEAMIIDVNSTKLQDLGISWAASANSHVVAGFGDVTTPDDTAIALGIAHGGTVAPSTLVVSASSYFLSRLRLLEDNGDARVQSRPSILTEENRGAVLDFSETFYLKAVGERVADIQPVTVGTSLRVTPRVVMNDGQQSIMLTIDIEDGQIEERRRIEDMPTIRESKISTEALIRADQSLLIGGYNHDENVANIQRVPFLGNLPIVGLLFSKRTHSVQRRERLFMIHPRIVSLPVQEGRILSAIAKEHREEAAKYLMFSAPVVLPTHKVVAPPTTLPQSPARTIVVQPAVAQGISAHTNFAPLGFPYRVPPNPVAKQSTDHPVVQSEEPTHDPQQLYFRDVPKVIQAVQNYQGDDTRPSAAVNPPMRGLAQKVVPAHTVQQAISPGQPILHFTVPADGRFPTVPQPTVPSQPVLHFTMPADGLPQDMRLSDVPKDATNDVILDGIFHPLYRRRG